MDCSLRSCSVWRDFLVGFLFRKCTGAKSKLVASVNLPVHSVTIAHLGGIRGYGDASGTAVAVFLKMGIQDFALRCGPGLTGLFGFLRL